MILVVFVFQKVGLYKLDKGCPLGLCHFIYEICLDALEIRKSVFFGKVWHDNFVGIEIIRNVICMKHRLLYPKAIHVTKYYINDYSYAQYCSNG
jgi:hypothetical protein